MHAFPPEPHWQREFLTAEQLPDDYLQIIREVLLPVSSWLQSLRTDRGPLLVGINGAQGTGKSTLARGLAQMLEETFDCSTVNLSLDDFYLTRAQRQSQADAIHPLLMTRGVPGTHDIAMAQEIIDRLQHAAPGDPVAIPRFDKSRDDRMPADGWPVVTRQPDIIVLEGWCVGTPPQDETALQYPANRMEAEDDRDGRWRSHVNRQLREVYQPLFRRLDRLIMLKAPSFHAVYEWRCLQEDRLAARLNTPVDDSELKLMDREGIRRFLQHYERLTRHALRVLPPRADLVLHLNARHVVTRMAPALPTPDETDAARA